MRVLLFNDLHYGNKRSIRERLVTAEALSSLKSMIPVFNSFNPDLLVAMGDLVQKTSRAVSTQEFLEVLQVLKPFSKKLLFLKGNHEDRVLGSDHMSELLRSEGFDPSLQGITRTKLFNLVRLETHEARKDGKRIVEIRDDQLRIVEEAKGKPTIMLMHQAPRMQSLNNNYYYEKLGDPTIQSVKDQSFYSKLTKNKHLKLIFHAHTHWLSQKIDQGVITMANPSFSEMIGSKLGPRPNPQVFSVLDVIQGRAGLECRWQVFSGTLAFASLEFDLLN